MAHQRAAAVQLVHRRGVDGVGAPARPQEADVIDARCEVRHQVARSPCRSCRASRTSACWAGSVRFPMVNWLLGRPVDSGSGLPAHFAKCRLRVEQVHLARPADHEHEDDPLRLRLRSAASVPRVGFWFASRRLRGLRWRLTNSARCRPAHRLSETRTHDAICAKGKCVFMEIVYPVRECAGCIIVGSAVTITV